MNQTANVILAYILLFAGLILIILPLYQAYQVIALKAFVPDIFKVSQQAPSAQPPSQFDIQKQIEGAVAKAFPTELIVKTLNLTSWIALLLVFIFGGKQLAELGIRLMKV